MCGQPLLGLFLHTICSIIVLVYHTVRSIIVLLHQQIISTGRRGVRRPRRIPQSSRQHFAICRMNALTLLSFCHHIPYPLKAPRNLKNIKENISSLLDRIIYLILTADIKTKVLLKVKLVMSYSYHE